jgi:hypothetical protein
MKFDKSKAEFSVLEPGTYDFTVVEAEDTIYEQNDNEPQIKVLLRIYYGEDNTILLNQWLSSTVKVYRLKQFLGLQEDWEAEEVDPADLFGLSGKLELTVYEDRNKVKRNGVGKYYPLEEEEVEPKKKPKAKAKPKPKKTDDYSTNLDDDIPF